MGFFLLYYQSHDEKNDLFKEKRQNNGSSILDKTDEGWRRKRRFLAVG